MEINESNFEKEVMQSEQIVLIDFYAPWCGPCKMLNPALESIKNKNNGRVKVLKVNIDESNSTSLAIKYNVSAIPMMVFIKAGNLVQTLVGLQSETAIQETIDSLASV